MNVHTITSPSGHIVEFKDRLTFGERRQVNRLMVEKMKFNLDADGKDKKTKLDPISAAVMFEMQELVFKLAIVSVTEKGKEKKSGSGEELIAIINDWEEADGQFVFDEVDKKFNPTQKKT